MSIRRMINGSLATHARFFESYGTLLACCSCVIHRLFQQYLQTEIAMSGEQLCVYIPAIHLDVDV